MFALGCPFCAWCRAAGYEANRIWYALKNLIGRVNIPSVAVPILKRSIPDRSIKLSEFRIELSLNPCLNSLQLGFCCGRQTGPELPAQWLRFQHEISNPIFCANLNHLRWCGLQTWSVAPK